MSRRFTLIPVAFIAIVGAVWASSLMIPDSPTFPSLPSTPGTLGDVLKNKFRGDGTALNGQRLGGTGALQYMKSTSCTTIDAVWKGIDASGNPICKGPPLAFAEIIEGTMTVNGVGGRGPGTKLIEGDKIETNATQTGTIRFTNNPGPATGAVGPGDSIARLSTGTTVLVDRGDTAGTLALITLQDGLLWGRVLTSTGINFGGGGVIAGVRGTSIALEKVAGQPLVRMVVPHSQRTGNSLANAAAILKTINIDGTSAPLQFRRSIEFNSGAISAPTGITSTNRTLQALYTTWQPTRLSPWIARNTVLDLGYMRNAEQTAMITSEIAATEPAPTNFGERRTLCSTGNKIYSDATNGCVFGYMDIGTTQGKLIFGSGIGIQDYTFPEWTPLANNNSSKRVTNNIGDRGTTYGALTNYNHILGGGDPASVTIGRRAPTRPFRYAEFANVLSYIPGGCPLSRTFCSFLRVEGQGAGYIGTIVETIPAHTSATEENWNNASYTYSGVYLVRNTPGTGVTVPPDTNINATAKYLRYLGESGPRLSELAGKTITIELNSFPTSTGGVLVDFGVPSYRVQKTGPTTFACMWTAEPNCVSVLGNTVSIKAPPSSSNISAFIIGNNSLQIGTVSPFTRPIGVTINRIIISN